MEQKSNETEIDLKEIFFLLLSKIWIIVGATIYMALMAFLITKVFITPMYTSKTTMYVMNKESNTAITYSDLQVSSQLTTDYLEIVKSRTVLQEVIDALELDMTVNSLKNRIVVSSPANSRIIEMTVEDEDPDVAKAIADSLAKISGEYIMQKMHTESVDVIDEGNLPAEPSSPSTVKNTVIGAALGMIIAVGIIIVRFMLDDTLQSEEDIERLIGCASLAAIPFVDSLDDSADEKARKKRARDKMKKKAGGRRAKN